MKFSEFLTFEKFEQFFIHYQKDNNDSNWHAEHQKILESNFHIPLVEFLTYKRDTEGLTTINFSEGHSTKFSNAWNSLIIDKNTDNSHHISEAFQKMLFESTFNYTQEPITTELIKKFYNKLIENFDKGSFHYFQLSADNCQCSECGQRLHIITNSWKLAFGVMGHNEEGKLTLVKPESCLENKIQEIEVNFPTGELIVTDWLRIEEFTKSVDYNKEDKWEDDKSICFPKGRIFMTKYYAQEHNFIHVSVGNSSPHVFQNSNNLVIGCKTYNDDKDDYEEINPNSGYKEEAQVCTDLWDVTIVDKQTEIK